MRTLPIRAPCRTKRRTSSVCCAPDAAGGLDDRPVLSPGMAEHTAPSRNAAPSRISIDLFGLQCYDAFQTTWRVVAFLAPPSIGRRSRPLRHESRHGRAWVTFNVRQNNGSFYEFHGYERQGKARSTAHNRTAWRDASGCGSSPSRRMGGRLR